MIQLKPLLGHVPLLITPYIGTGKSHTRGPILLKLEIGLCPEELTI